MEGTFDEAELFAAIAASGARALLIGRRALTALGLPVLTADDDLWIHGDDAEALNDALAPLGLRPTHPASEARARGRYVLENDEHIDVRVARSVGTIDGRGGRPAPRRAAARMTRRLEPPSPERLAALRADADRQLSRAEFDAYVHAPMSDAEREEIRSLVAWFTRRYPTAQERLAYARRAYVRWARARPPGY